MPSCYNNLKLLNELYKADNDMFIDCSFQTAELVWFLCVGVFLLRPMNAALWD